MAFYCHLQRSEIAEIFKIIQLLRSATNDKLGIAS
jgi:hypothetical protein